MKAIRLKTAHLVDPLGIDIRKPLLTWNADIGVSQTAYQIIACLDGQEVWNTGKIEGNEMQAVYKGPAVSRTRIQWQVRLWDENGAAGEYCDPAWFEYALLTPQEFKAKWIDPETESFDPEKNQPVSILVKEFDLTDTKNARAYATSHGMYALYLNGRRIKDNVLPPGTSEYWFRQPYQTFDVSGYLVVGKNRIEVTLGDGWWRGNNGNTAYYAQSCRMIGEIAEILGNGEDAKKYNDLADKAAKAFNFIEVQDGHIHSERQCKYVRPLKMGLLPKKEAERTAADLNNLVVKNGYHLNTGCFTLAGLLQLASAVASLH